MSRRCPACHAIIHGGICTFCGSVPEPDDRAADTCEQCRYPLQPEWSFCPLCGLRRGADPRTPARSLACRCGAPMLPDEYGAGSLTWRCPTCGEHQVEDCAEAVFGSAGADYPAGWRMEGE